MIRIFYRTTSFLFPKSLIFFFFAVISADKPRFPINLRSLFLLRNFMNKLPFDWWHEERTKTCIIIRYFKSIDFIVMKELYPVKRVRWLPSQSSSIWEELNCCLLAFCCRVSQSDRFEAPIQDITYITKLNVFPRLIACASNLWSQLQAFNLAMCWLKESLIARFNKQQASSNKTLSSVCTLFGVLKLHISWKKPLKSFSEAILRIQRRYPS